MGPRARPVLLTGPDRRNSGQATRMILESNGSVHGGSWGMPGWGKPPSFRAVMSAISLLPEETRPRVNRSGARRNARSGEMQRCWRGCAHDGRR